MLTKNASPLPGLRQMRRYLLVFVAFFVALAAFRSVALDWDVVPSASMLPTIQPGEHLLVNKLAYDLKIPFTSLHLLTWGHPRRGEVVILLSPLDGKKLAKRVVGVPGDTVELRNNRLHLGGVPAEGGSPDEAIEASTRSAGDGGNSQPADSQPSSPAVFGPVTVPPNHYFVLGDNRAESIDSRKFGSVERAQIIGRVVGTRPLPALGPR